MLRRRANKSAQIEQRRWSDVADLLKPGETPVEYTPAHVHLSGREGRGHVFLTDMQVILCFSESGNPPFDRLSVPLAATAVVPMKREGGLFGTGVLIDTLMPGGSARAILKMYTSPITDVVVERLAATAGRGVRSLDQLDDEA